MSDLEDAVKKVLQKYSSYGLDDELTLDKLVKPAVLACSTVSGSKRELLSCLNDSYVLTRKKLASVADEFRGKETNEENLEKLRRALNDICIKGTKQCLGDMHENLIKACSRFPRMDQVLECIEEGVYFAQLANENAK